ncbi:DNA polymerase III subunit gamma/tau [Candidatus Karelsulcia muelleri]|nr:DNA polymerase III subunit gamma/tau [Candidatus Karelsulcia muelleri]WDI79509.1 DNA polymerase III subunit gamma/tau [Candidatus Karelsulcia muelleri]WDR78967.1 DNA polymerase III subunit gamma/tau [Candidatus Karelsulcia muelleri]
MSKASKYQISAIKYRPLDFENVIGQKHITDTLKKAISQKKVAKSFLFCGPKGVGKTTCARILARKLNNVIELDSAYELDAASNNSVDDIKDIIKKLNYLPFCGKYNIYIIDEVHMLSHSAFNAFLKVLEEPPSHVIFILATTEKNKVLPTVLSRCQIYDFKHINIKNLMKALIKICTLENVEYEKDALLLIAENSEGSLRDALSSFDRLKLFSNNKISRKIVAKQLGILDIQYCLQITELIIEKNIIDKNILKTLLYFEKLIKKGINRNCFINHIAAHFRNLLVLKNNGTIQFFNYSEKFKNRLYAQSKKVSYNFLIKALIICEKTDNFIRKSYNKRLTIEITLVKLIELNFSMRQEEYENL